MIKNSVSMLISNLPHRNMNCNVFESSSKTTLSLSFAWKVSVVLVYISFSFLASFYLSPSFNFVICILLEKTLRFTAVLSESSCHSYSYKLKIISKLLNKFKLYFFFDWSVKKTPYITSIIICNIRSSCV